MDVIRVLRGARDIPEALQSTERKMKPVERLTSTAIGFSSTASSATDLPDT